ncbi:MAG TPA: hypothetical protein DC009_00385 [Porphyromonadaceae bacterium]|nr:hypothetical protein [Porphyromonadaceae bacterium]
MAARMQLWQGVSYTYYTYIICQGREPLPTRKLPPTYSPHLEGVLFPLVSPFPCPMAVNKETSVNKNQEYVRLRSAVFGRFQPRTAEHAEQSKLASGIASGNSLGHLLRVSRKMATFVQTNAKGTMTDRISSTAAPSRQDSGNLSEMAHYIVMCLGMFARQHGLTRREACNYLHRLGGLKFAIDNYEAEHQLSLQDCVDDMAAVCRRNGGAI